MDKWIYLDKISDPGNMGTLIRSCEWFGIENIALSPKCADPYNPKSLACGINWVIEDEERNKKLSLQSRLKVQNNWDSKIIAKKYIEAYHSALSNH